jgi:hypothetical protein
MEAEGPESPSVSRHRVVSVVPEHDLLEPFSDVWDGVVQPAPKPGLHRLQLRPEPLLHRQSDHLKVAVPCPPTRVGEPEKVEGVRFALAPPLSFLGRKASELDQAGVLPT